MLVQRCPIFVARSVLLSALGLLGSACSEASSPQDGAGGAGAGASAGKAGGGAGAASGVGGTGTAGSGGTTAGSPNAGGTLGSTGGANTAGSTSSGAGGLNSAGTGGAGGAPGGAPGAGGGMMAGAPGAGSGAGGAAGAGGANAGTGGGSGAGGSAAGGPSGGAGGTAGAGGNGGMPSTRSAGCGKPLQRPNPRTQQTMDRDGTTRYYLLDVPANTDNQTPLALVFGLHGYDMNNVAVVDLFNFTSRSNGRAITVLPQGEGPPPGDVSHWGDHVLESTWMAGETNYSYIRALMLDLEDRYCVDLNRVFISGFSMGGFFTNSLACAHSDWFRAFAPVSGGGPGSCANANAKPAIIIHHGTADDIVTIDNGEGSRDFWVQQNGCNQMTSQTLTGCQRYGGCPEASPVLWCTGNWNHTISSTAAGNVWTFFDSFK